MSRPPSDHDADRLGREVLRGRLGLRPKEAVTIECYPSSLAWAAGFVREARRAGAYPIVHFEDEGSYWDAAEHGRAKLLGALPKHEQAALDATDVYVFFWGPEDTGRRDRLRGPDQDAIFAFNPKWYERAKKAGLRGARMAIARATEANARRFGVSVAQWRSQLLAASLHSPESLQPAVRRLEKPLGGRGEARLTHPNGTDLRLALADRPVQKATGALPPQRERGTFGFMVNVPDGSVYVAVDESTAEGTLVANRRSSAAGPILEGGRWTFRDGRLTSRRFAKGGSDFEAVFRRATGDKDRVSFLEVGVTPDLRGTPYLEENERGAVTVGIGNNASFGGKNQSSLFQCLTVAGASLTIGGKTVLTGGRIV
jgi:leucyl aminopeptidase (aminopeptidase T)